MDPSLSKNPGTDPLGERIDSRGDFRPSVTVRGLASRGSILGFCKISAAKLEPDFLSGISEPIGTTVPFDFEGENRPIPPGVGGGGWFNPRSQ